MGHIIISENRAWEIIGDYASELLRLDRNGVRAVYATGSLGGGYYRPGKSDIDTVVIVKDDASLTQEAADAIATRYGQQYGVPKSFGTVLMAEKDLFPPYHRSEQEEFEFALEIVRLKLQGKAVYGSYNLSRIPLPSKNDLIHDAWIMENWFDKAYGSEMFQQFEQEGCVNTILWYIRRYLMIEKHIFVLNKFETIPAYIQNGAPVADNQVFALIDAVLHGDEASKDELDLLRRFGKEIRAHMNKALLNRYIIKETSSR